MRSNDIHAKKFNDTCPFIKSENWSLHGYKLIQELTRFGFTSIDQGNVYRTLRQLEKDDLIKSEWDTTQVVQQNGFILLQKLVKLTLSTCTDALEQYQSIINRFFTIYMDMFLPTKTNKQQDDEEKK